MKILCIDDDITFLTMYKRVLEKNIRPDDQVIVTPDPQGYEQICKEKLIDIVITDLVMPEKNGLEILKEVKKINAAIEVIVVTGQGSIDSAVEAMRHGARDYLTKPLNHVLLIEKIENLREFIERNNESEEYRYAKETIEENAMRSITEMEIKLSLYMGIVDEIKNIILHDSSMHCVSSKIAACINEFEKKISRNCNEL